MLAKWVGQHKEKKLLDLEQELINKFNITPQASDMTNQFMIEALKAAVTATSSRPVMASPSSSSTRVKAAADLCGLRDIYCPPILLSVWL